MEADLTSLIRRAVQGDRQALDALFEASYRELRKIARARLRGDRNQTLNTTSLVHESYLKFVEAGRLDIADRAHFLGYAGQAMRSIIVDLVRTRKADRHGGGAVRVTLDTGIDAGIPGEDEILRVHEALEVVEKRDPRMARVVEMRYFGGLTEVEIAEALGVTERTVRRDWEKARLLLAEALE